MKKNLLIAALLAAALAQVQAHAVTVVAAHPTVAAPVAPASRTLASAGPAKAPARPFTGTAAAPLPRPAEIHQAPVIIPHAPITRAADCDKKSKECKK